MEEKELAKIDDEIAKYNGWLGDRKFPKKNTRILMVSEGGKILRILVAEFNTESEIWKNKRYEYKKCPSEFPCYLYKYFSEDIGNCVHNWNEQDLMHAILHIFWSDNFIEQDECRRFIEIELSKIEEYYQSSLKHYKNAIYFAM